MYSEGPYYKGRRHWQGGGGYPNADIVREVAWIKYKPPVDLVPTFLAACGALLLLLTAQKG